MLAVVKRDEDDFASWLKKNAAKTAEKLEKLGIAPRDFLSTEVGWLSSLPKYNGSQIELDLFQIKLLSITRSKAKFRSMLKSRQVGYSFGIAGEMLARCHLRDRHVAVCVSYNLDDAKEKIALIKELHDELPLEFQKKIVIDSKTEVGFVSPSSKRRISKVVSGPSKAPRGKSGDIYWDEAAHCLNDRLIYEGATAVIIRSGGQLTIGSTPFGKRGMFYRIHSQELEQFDGYIRQNVPWWLCRQFCRDVQAASRQAPLMTTAERVEAFGTTALVDQFGANLIDNFQQEYELDFQDDRIAYFHHELILANARFERSELLYDSLEELAEDAIQGKLGPLHAGFDVGRVKHPSELVVVEKVADRFVTRYMESYKGLEFQPQFHRLSTVIEALGEHLRAFRIDATGVGRQLGEDLRRKYPRVEAFQFTNALKIELATNLKILMEGRAIDLPKDREIVGQLGSVRQKFTESGNAIFDVVANKQHHGDKVWALALAVRRRQRTRGVPADVGVRVIGAPVATQSKPALETARKGDAFDAIFDVPDRMIPRRPEFARDPVSVVHVGATDVDVLQGAGRPELERRARMLRLSIGVWKQSGDAEEIRRAETEYAGIRRELARRGEAPLGSGLESPAASATMLAAAPPAVIPLEDPL